MKLSLLALTLAFSTVTLTNAQAAERNTPRGQPEFSCESYLKMLPKDGGPGSASGIPCVIWIITREGVKYAARTTTAAFCKRYPQTRGCK